MFRLWKIGVEAAMGMDGDLQGIAGRGLAEIEGRRGIIRFIPGESAPRPRSLDPCHVAGPETVVEGVREADCFRFRRCGWTEGGLVASSERPPTPCGNRIATLSRLISRREAGGKRRRDPSRHGVGGSWPGGGDGAARTL